MAFLVSKNNGVFARRLERLDARVAVKTLRAARLGARPSRGALRAFKREVAVLSRLRHPCVVRLLGADLAPPDLCIVEELVEGGSLHVRIEPRRAARRRGRRGARLKTTTSPSTCASRPRWTCRSDVARAMAYLAARGVTHRDLKSQNVLLVFPGDAARQIDCEATRRGSPRRRLRAKVADFGIAKSRDDCVATGVEAILATNGTTGVITGGGAVQRLGQDAGPSWSCGAPRAGEEIGVPTRYSFGVVLWECLTGEDALGRLRDPVQIVFAVAVEGKRLPFPLEGERKSEDAEDAKGVGPRKKRRRGDGEERFFFRALLERCWAEDPRARPGFEEIGEVLRGLRASVPRAGEARAEP